MKSFVGYVTTGLLVAGLVSSAVAAPKTTAASIKARQTHANATSMARHKRVLGAGEARHKRVLHSEATSAARHKSVLGGLQRAHTAKLKKK